MADRRAQIAGDYADWLAARQAPYSATAAATLRRTEDRLGPSAVRYLLDALAEAEAERERWKEVADVADEVIRAVLAALYRGPDTGAVIRAREVMAERDALAAKLAAVEGLAETWDREGITCPCGHSIGGEHNSRGCYARITYNPLVECGCAMTDDQDEVDVVVARLRDALDGDA